MARVDQTPLEVGEPDTQHQGTSSSSAAAMLTEAWNQQERAWPLVAWELFPSVMEGREVRSAEATSTNEFFRLYQAVGSLG